MERGDESGGGGEGDVRADTNDNLNDDRVCKRFLAQLA